jgi:hypothetical protein
MRRRLRLAANTKMSIAIFLVAVFTVMSYLRLSSFAHAEVQRFPPALRHAKHGSKGAVSSENRLCSEAGVEMLRVGGNAADAVRFSTLA